MESSVNLTGRDQSHAPRYQLNFGLNYRITENLNIKFDIEAKDEFIFQIVTIFVLMIMYF